MELMDTSLDKFYRKVLDKNMTIPEDILGEIAVSVSDLALPSMHRTFCLSLGRTAIPEGISTSEALEHYLPGEAPGWSSLGLATPCLQDRMQSLGSCPF